MKIVLVGGTGRSGTWAMRNALDSHPHVNAIGRESWIFIKPYGLANIIETFRETTAIANREDAILRFKKWCFDRWKNHLPRIWPNIAERVDAFCDQLTNNKHDWLEMCRNFMLSLLRDFDNRNVTYVCEKTPHTLYCIQTLWLVVPEAKFIHIKRDPRGVIESWHRQRWFEGQGSIDNAAEYLKGLYRDWDKIRLPIQTDPRYFEVKLEDLCENEEQRMGEVLDFLGLPRQCMPTGCFKADKVTRWQNHEEHKKIDLLGRPYMELMGYE